MIAALLCALVGLALAVMLTPPWTLLALIPFFLSLWLYTTGGGKRWLDRRSGRA